MLLKLLFITATIKVEKNSYEIFLTPLLFQSTYSNFNLVYRVEKLLSMTIFHLHIFTPKDVIHTTKPFVPGRH